MQCEQCKSELTAKEPVWRYRKRVSLGKPHDSGRYVRVRDCTTASYPARFVRTKRYYPIFKLVEVCRDCVWEIFRIGDGRQW